MTSSDDDYVIFAEIIHFQNLKKFPEREIIILLRTHHTDVLVSVVVIADEMKKPMDDDPVEFILKFSPELDCILPYGIDAYEKVTGKTVALAIVESDDVGKVVVLEELLVDVEDIVIGTEDYGNVPYSEYLAFGRKLKPLVCLPPVPEIEVSVLKII